MFSSRGHRVKIVSFLVYLVLIDKAESPAARTETQNLQGWCYSVLCLFAATSLPLCRSCTIPATCLEEKQFLTVFVHHIGPINFKRPSAVGGPGRNAVGVHEMAKVFS